MMPIESWQTAVRFAVPVPKNAIDTCPNCGRYTLEAIILAAHYICHACPLWLGYYRDNYGYPGYTKLEEIPVAALFARANALMCGPERVDSLEAGVLAFADAVALLRVRLIGRTATDDLRDACERVKDRVAHAVLSAPHGVSETTILESCINPVVQTIAGQRPLWLMPCGPRTGLRHMRFQSKIQDDAFRMQKTVIIAEVGETDHDYNLLQTCHVAIDRELLAPDRQKI
jgi:hypothetical protein